ncbi:unnamed protein product, partial [Choristocarpus tenellus]
ASTPGGWLTAGRLGAPNTENSEIENKRSRAGGGTNGESKWGVGKGKTTTKTEGTGGWLSVAVSSGCLGFPCVEEEDTDEDTSSSGRGRDPKNCTVGTQTEDRQDTPTPSVASKPRFPPWAKLWSIPAADPVPDPVPNQDPCPVPAIAPEPELSPVQTPEAITAVSSPD